LLREDSAEYGEFKLSLQDKAAILRNNIFGVDIDPQAVEITMMSLYIKMLEGERGIIAGRALLPRLRDNIKCGNSLIGYDIGTLSDEEKARINPFDWNSKGEGFGEIMAAGGFDAVIGNPPYIRMENLKELKAYLKANYAAHDERSDLYAYIIERAHHVLSKRGRFGMIVSNKFLRANYGKPLRDFLVRNAKLERIVDFAGLPVFKERLYEQLCCSRHMNQRANLVRCMPSQ
jgi:type I restriction-modification system DNA methylase subunit